MPRGSGRRTWIKLYCYGRLHGSVVYQLTEAEQSIWDKLLCYAGLIGREGQISDNDNRPFPHSFIAHELHTTEELLESTLEKCKAEGRITEDEHGIHITNWQAYQSEYDRQKPYREDKDREETGVYKLYAEGIGELTPAIRAALTRAAAVYPEPWIEDAINEAVRGGDRARNWRYISAILKSWTKKGRMRAE